jgi:hypothetical protein
MRHRRLPVLLTLLILSISSLVTLNAVDPGVTLIGVGFVPVTALDDSGLDGQPICQVNNPANCIDQATLVASVPPWRIPGSTTCF